MFSYNLNKITLLLIVTCINIESLFGIVLLTHVSQLGYVALDRLAMQDLASVVLTVEQRQACFPHRCDRLNTESAEEGECRLSSWNYEYKVPPVSNTKTCRLGTTSRVRFSLQRNRAFAPRSARLYTQMDRHLTESNAALKGSSNCRALAAAVLTSILRLSTW